MTLAEPTTLAEAQAIMERYSSVVHASTSAVEVVMDEFALLDAVAGLSRLARLGDMNPLDRAFDDSGPAWGRQSSNAMDQIQVSVQAHDRSNAIKSIDQPQIGVIALR
jgi:hypothetical protein